MHYGRQALHLVDHDDIFQRPRLEEESVALFQRHGTGEFWLVVIVTQMGDLVQVAGISES